MALLVGYGRQDPMLLLLVLLWLGLLVAVVSGLLRLQRQFNRRAANARFVYSSQPRRLDGYREPGWIGDWRCVYNARSPSLRCAVHPTGPCRGCAHYEAVPRAPW